jgi:UDP-N-acetylglucosamine 2-epimerase (non-hydrolysing)
MLDQVMRIFDLASDADLGIMQPGQSLTDITVRGLERLAPLFRDDPSDLVLVHGDTTTTLVATLAAFYQKIPVGHVEAGLRSYDIHNPYPEEINRKLCDAICALHFAPTENARQNLLRENVKEEGIFVTGNTGIDGLRIVTERMSSASLAAIADGVKKAAEHPFILLTAHRRENFGEPLANLCQAITALCRQRPDLHVVYPVHLNPSINGPVHAALQGIDNVHLLPPLDYKEMVFLMQRCIFVVTDSGGIQEEAPALGKPVLVLRNVTERPEAVTAGTARVIGTETAEIHRWISTLLDDQVTFDRMAKAVNPYGDGRAADRTLEAIQYYFGLRAQRPAAFSP